MKLPGMQRLMKIMQAISERLDQAIEATQRISCKILGIVYAHSNSSENTDDLEANTLPIAYNNNHLGPGETPTSPTFPRRISDVLMSEPPKSPQLPNSPSEKEPLQSPDLPSPGKQLWAKAMRTVQMHSAVSSKHGISVMTREPHRQRTISSNLTGERKRAVVEEPVKAILRSRVARLQPKLKQLEATQDLAAHQALVRHLQFSPDGRYLATSR